MFFINLCSCLSYLSLKFKTPGLTSRNLHKQEMDFSWLLVVFTPLQGDDFVGSISKSQKQTNHLTYTDRLNSDKGMKINLLFKTHIDKSKLLPFMKLIQKC